MSLTHYTVVCETFPRKGKLPAQLALAREPDASAIHGRLGAQVALLQSPILPTATKSYKKELKKSTSSR
jgi:hypothetical protein